ncbi:hypothetical protein D5086_009552 [Populus alba]|uniref:Uncharacterized protein n=1 Tax=Populus alba TaxID=43335 RepID=A0ACC4CK42_POPAL
MAPLQTMSGCGAVTGGGGHHKNWNRGKLAAALVGWWWWQLCQERIPLYQRQNSYRIPNFIAINIPILDQKHIHQDKGGKGSSNQLEFGSSVCQTPNAQPPKVPPKLQDAIRASINQLPSSSNE